MFYKPITDKEKLARKGMMLKLKAIACCLLVFLCVVGYTWMKIEAYGGDADCLFVRCVKVKQ